jgi:hypothetical protein
MHFSSLFVAVLPFVAAAVAAPAAPLEDRQIKCAAMIRLVTATFDDIKANRPVPKPYQGFVFPGFKVDNPNRHDPFRPSSGEQLAINGKNGPRIISLDTAARPTISFTLNSVNLGCIKNGRAHNCKVTIVPRARDKRLRRSVEVKLSGGRSPAKLTPVSLGDNSDFGNLYEVEFQVGQGLDLVVDDFQIWRPLC